jgi:DtxR family Mn-dependent transcriptional regulator
MDIDMVSQIKLSESEEMYLITIRKICERIAKSLVPIPAIAEGLGVQPVSVNQMIKKMSEAGLVKYTPYKGVELTVAGQAKSSRVLRHRRLWEVFLVKVLKMELDEADALACQLEHITSEDVADRLSEFLGHPTVCFHGNPIPQLGERTKPRFEGLPLKNLKVGDTSHVMRIMGDSVTTNFLSDEGIRPGIRVRVLAIGSQGDLLLESPEGRTHLSAEMAAIVIVGSLSPPEEEPS